MSEQPVAVTNSAGMDDLATSRERLRRRLDVLPLEAQVCFALVCAERLVGHAATRPNELHVRLSQAWSALSSPLTSRDQVTASRQSMDAWLDLDDDPVAAVAYALDAVLGARDAAFSVATRAQDAAFERVPYPEGTTEFRPLAEDAAHPQVTAELTWQEQAVTVAEDGGSATDLAARLRGL